MFDLRKSYTNPAADQWGRRRKMQPGPHVITHVSREKLEPKQAAAEGRRYRPIYLGIDKRHIARSKFVPKECRARGCR